ncbi:hypothetical protein GSI_03249 [Ganoderma sinense ZZ0214-1]|uniref:Uncharacterized protein n=1 Tax=Ganoderma sinense ZZ0214-1 TaxID=1077348 RepID=A0A2G8SL29_9APHY|nr:hypothetical protein GSI_03249 [Ganoderma sinense ZZ0214-1]
MSDPNAVFQHSYYIGNNFNAILYGVELVLYFASVRLIMQGRYRVGEARRRSDRRFLYLSTGLLLMITVYVAVQAVFGEEMWIVHVDYPGGSAQYLADNAAVWYQTLGSAASIVLNLMSDGLLIYRTSIVWSDWRVAIFPSLLYVATAALGVLTCYASGTPNSDFFTGSAALIALSYSSVVIVLNCTCSALICIRIVSVSRRMQRTLGHDAAAQAYASVVALIVEAMLPYTLFGLAYVVTLGTGHPTAIFWLSVYVMMTCISPQMIILRVLMGRAWSQDVASGTALPSSSLTASNSKFNPNFSNLNENVNAKRLSAMTVASPNRARFTYSSEATAVNLKTLSPSKVSLSGSREFRDSKTFVDVPLPSPSAWTVGSGSPIGTAL